MGAFKAAVFLVWLVLCGTVLATGSAFAGSYVMTTSLAPTTTTGVTTSGSATTISNGSYHNTFSGEVVTIDSDQLTSETDNPIIFRATGQISYTATNYQMWGNDVSTTAPKAGSATQTTITSSLSTITKDITIPVDKVPLGSSTVSFTITMQSYSGRQGVTVANCAAASTIADQTFCETRTITVNVTPATTSTTTSVNTSAITNNFVRRRARNISNAEPDLSDQLGDNTDDGEVSSVTYKATGSLEGYDATFSASTGSQLAGQGYGAGNNSANPFNFWIDGTVARSKEAGQRQDFAVSHFGIGYRANLDLIYGIMAQVDYAKEVNGSAHVRGTGWLLGPYLAARLRDNLLFDGRIAYGQSDNKVSPIGTYIDQFDTTRFLIRGQLKGDIQHDDWTIAPTFGFNYIHEIQHAYTDSLNAVIPEATIELGQVIFGTEFKTEILTDNGLIVTPKFGVKGLWNFKDSGFLDTVTNTVRTDLVGDLSARLDFGFGIANDSGLTLDFNGFFDGIGASNYEAYGATATLAVKF
ncbi:MAG: autotransporter outer membrane beta-barrel domain-containing protein [Lentilitoribacter sp.]